jgi:hypothetical protein
MSQQCWQGYHKALALGVGVPVILLLCFVYPGSVLVFMLRHHGGSLYTAEYSFLFSMYKPTVAWWEVVVIVQMSVLVAITVFSVRLGTYFGCVVLMVAYFVVLSLLISIRPYACKAVGAVATRGAQCVFITSMATLLFMPAGTISGQAGAYEQYGIAVGVVVLCLNVAFVLSVVWQVSRLVRWKVLAGKVKDAFTKCFGVRQPGVPGAPARLHKGADNA